MNRKNNFKSNTPLLTALYCRLSLEDGKDNESMSISNQKLLLKDFAEKSGMFNCEFYVDDGFTGRNFRRPAFQRMINDIEAGRISCVITKDLSRLGRNYIESGSYMEVFFPKHNVRYIAITDNYDSLNKQEMDIAPFKNILNDMYSRDISKKVLAGRMTRSRQGKFCGGQPPLGLMRDPDDNGHLIIDPETAPVIRRIFDLALDGFGNMKICKVLMEERIPITRMQTGTDCDVNYYAWSGSRISTILRNPFYKGAHVVCKTHQKGIRSNTYNIIPREQREVIEDCHEAIIPKAEWDKVQQLIDRRPPIMKGNSCPYYNIFHGIVYCATCGKSMQVRYEKVGRTNKDRRTGKEREPIDKAYYICQTYNRLGKNACTSHKIEARDLYNLVLSDIQEVAAMALKDKEAFYGKLSRRMEKQYLADTDSLKKEYENLAQRNQEIDDTFISLYADKAKGILTEKRFLKLTDAMEKEQENNQNRMQEIAALISEEEHSEGDVQMFMGEIRRYAAITELDETVLNRLLNRILIGEPKKVDGVKTQEVRIVYNFVGEL
ncbi:MAG: recombinase family protein [Lachnospiraceae bacterium]|nr:recombinase family protein [Lachnospiraceae bacterium]